MELIDKKPIIDFIKKGLNNPNKEEAFGHDAIQILAEIEYAPVLEKFDGIKIQKGYWTVVDGDQCSNCGHYLSDIMDADSYYAIGFVIDDIVACPFCGTIMKEVNE